MYTIEINIETSNYPDFCVYTLYKKTDEKIFCYQSYKLETLISFCVSKGIDVKELSFENKLVKNGRNKRDI